MGGLEPYDHAGLKMLGFLAVILIILVAVRVSAAMAMGLFGSMLLVGGLIWLYLIDLLHRKKNIEALK